jgi:hypothetical protein
MPNSNVLEGMVCPACKSEEPFIIGMTITAFVEVSDDGFDYAEMDMAQSEWEGPDFCACVACNWEGTVHDFRIESQARTGGSTAERSDELKDDDDQKDDEQHPDDVVDHASIMLRSAEQARVETDRIP